MEYRTCITIRLLCHRFYNNAKSIAIRRISPILSRNWSFLWMVEKSPEVWEGIESAFWIICLILTIRILFFNLAWSKPLLYQLTWLSWLIVWLTNKKRAKRTDKWGNSRFAYRHNHKNIFVNLRWKNTAYAPHVFVRTKTYTLKFICNNCTLKMRTSGY